MTVMVKSGIAPEYEPCTPLYAIPEPFVPVASMDLGFVSTTGATV